MTSTPLFFAICFEAPSRLPVTASQSSGAVVAAAKQSCMNTQTSERSRQAPPVFHAPIALPRTALPTRRIVVGKATGVIKQITIGDKEAMTVRTSTGTVEREVKASKRHAQVLSMAQVEKE